MDPDIPPLTPPHASTQRISKVEGTPVGAGMGQWKGRGGKEQI